MIRPAATVLVVLVVTASPLAHANTPEDVGGLGARAAAMGGAGTANAMDPSALYYNPASLSFCPSDAVLLDARRTSKDLQVTGEPPAAAKPVEDDTRITVGTCQRGPFGISFGVAFGTSLGHPLRIDETTPSPTPQFVLYGDLQDHTTILFGLAFAFSERVSVGLGLSVLTSSTLSIGAAVPLLAGDQGEVSSAIRMDLDPVAAPYLGVHVRPDGRWHLGAAYRSPLFHQLNAPATVDANLAGVPVRVDLMLQSVSWYSPRSLSAGATWTGGPLTLTTDLTWYQWSAYPGPYIGVTAAGMGGVADSLNYPPREDPGFRDIVVPRVGGELRSDGGPAVVRAGLAYQPAIVGMPRGRGQLLDSAAVSISAGAGYSWRLDTSSTRTSVTLDGFARVRHLSSQDVTGAGDAGAPASTYSFGGDLIDVGVTATVGWE